MTTYCCTNKNPDGSVKQAFIYYRCPAHTMKTCDMGKQFNQDKLEEWLVANLRTEAEKFNFTLDQQRKSLPKKTVDTSKIMSRIEKLKDLYLNDLLPKEIYERDYNELSRILKEAAQEKEEKSVKPLNLSKLDNFAESYQKLDLESRKAFWSRIISSITVTPEGDFTLIFNQL